MAKPISFSHIPIGLTYGISASKQCDEFAFLKSDAINKKGHPSHSVIIQPSEWDLPWPSSFPAARQCKYWKEIQLSCEQYMREVRALSIQLDKKVPEGYCRTAGEQPLTPKESLIVSTAVDAATYMIPNAPCERVEVISKLWILLWTHDDVVECFPEEAFTVVDDITDSLLRVCRGLEDLSRNEICLKFKLTSDLLGIPGGLTQTVLETFADFIFFTRTQQRNEFKDLRDYLDYRAIDIAMDHILAAVRFGNDLDLRQEEIDPLRHFSGLVSDHNILVNDLFSFDKEKRAAVTQDALLLNAVDYLQQNLLVSSALAKDHALCLVFDVESRLQDELRQISRMRTLSEAQIQYVRAMVECASGNLLFSVTSVRYGKGASGPG
ncbi:terpenoid synthase [Penicillium coprophilum]|uniref:terpenoid synthase n=1 Tax=Penicillium coprophilum TaxID=36646 RepID=UPI0023839E38|nr:terpenoid synthase [Penicillium coprophilum]KAJ5177655.1 terpenoid synthase [Penicillium coprophilum]